MTQPHVDHREFLTVLYAAVPTFARCEGNICQV